MANHPRELVAAVEQNETDLQDLIDGLRERGTITESDATEFTYRAEIIAAELRACVEFAADDPPSEYDDEG
jgi:hypothetical protein